MPRFSNTTQEQLTNIRSTLQGLSLEIILIALAMLLASVILIRLIMVLVGKLLRQTRLDNSIHRLIKGLLRALLYFAAILIVASYVGIDVTSLVALLSVISLALSLSVQSVLSNLAGGVMVMGTKPFKTGDYISVDGLEGTVEDLSIVYTKLHTLDNRAVLIPNSKVAATTIENFTALGKRRLGITVTAAYGSEPERVLEALRRAAQRCGPLENTPIVAEIQDFGESAIAYDLALWIPATEFLARRWALRRYIWEEFKAAGIEMTYPHLNVHLKN